MVYKADVLGHLGFGLPMPESEYNSYFNNRQQIELDETHL